MKNAIHEAQTLYATVFIASTIAQRDGSAGLRGKTFLSMAYVTTRIGVSESELWLETRKRVATVMGAEQQPADRSKKPCEPSKKKVSPSHRPTSTKEFMSHGNTWRSTGAEELEII